MRHVASELRYDPNADDTRTGRGPSALLRVLTTAASGVFHAHTATDVYEGICRALAECGITVAVLATSGPAGAARCFPLAHRLALSLESMPALPGLVALGEEARLFPPGMHPLSAHHGTEGPLAFPSIAVALPEHTERGRVVISLFAPELGPEHLAGVEAFAVQVSAILERIATESRTRELHARRAGRARRAIAPTGPLADLAVALLRASSAHEAARITVAHARPLLAAPVAGLVLCQEGRHLTFVSGRDSTGEFERALHAHFRARASPAHADCRNDPPVPTAPRAAVPAATDGRIPPMHPQACHIVESTIVAEGCLIGLLAAGGLAPDQAPAQVATLVHTLARYLAATIERIARTHAAERGRVGALFESFKDGVVLLDPQARLITGNAPGRNLYVALSRAEGRSGPPAPLLNLVTTALDRHGRATGALITDEDPPQRIAAIATAVPNFGGEPVVAVTLHDMTDAEVMRERLFQSEKMASVGQLVSGVAHELNNPLQGIVGFAQLLLLRDLDPTARHQAETIFAEAERASRIVHTLLSFARRRRPEKVPLDLNALIERVLELWQYGLRVKDIEVRREFAAWLPPVLADPHQIQQVLLNLLGNAAQAIASRPLPGVITIRTAIAGGYVRVVLTDNGPGIAPEHLRRVFDPFFSTKPPGEGTGLGLTITFGIIEEHNGRITADSPPGGGAVFTFELPVASAPPSPAPPPRHDREPARSGHSVLIVDDEQTIRHLLADVLALSGYQVVTVGSAAEALDQIARTAFDAVITDIRMPGMDGIEFFHLAAARDPALSRRIIFMSGDTVSRETQGFAESAGVPFLPKPFTVADVRDLLASVLTEA